MPLRRATSEHQDAVARRLALLSAELAGEGSDDPPGSAVPAVPVPGRHASRRPISIPGLLPESLRGRIALGPAQLAVVAVVVTLALALTCWWVLRSSPERLDAPPVTPAPVALTSAPSSTSTAPVAVTGSGVPGSSQAPLGTVGAVGVVVDVTGKVRRPGIVELDAGARVVDALEAAGGARPGVDLSSLNLARVLVDGEQVVVGVPPPAGAAAAAAAPVSSVPGGALVNLNTASQEQLEALPEVGPVTAQAILAWRDAHGGFTTVDELLEVDGIGDATLSQLAPYVTL